jgi:hypothetical protein
VAVSQADIDELNDAIASGTRQVTIGGQSVTYNTIESLIKARNDLRNELKRETQALKRSRQAQAYYGGRGF